MLGVTPARGGRGPALPRGRGAGAGTGLGGAETSCGREVFRGGTGRRHFPQYLDWSACVIRSVMPRYQMNHCHALRVVLLNSVLSLTLQTTSCSLALPSTPSSLLQHGWREELEAQKVKIMVDIRTIYWKQQ
ncbi:hypothetical protein Nmel_005716 [Mimus melanotis]